MPLVSCRGEDVPSFHAPGDARDVRSHHYGLFMTASPHPLHGLIFGSLAAAGGNFYTRLGFVPRGEPDPNGEIMLRRVL